MFKSVARGLVLAVTLWWLAGTASPSLAQRGPQPKASPRAQSSPSPVERIKPGDQDTELEFVDSEQAFWNSRAVNAPVYQDGGSVNSVMFENRAVRDLRRTDVLPPTRVEEVRVLGPSAPATVIRIQGRQVALPPVVSP